MQNTFIRNIHKYTCIMYLPNTYFTIGKVQQTKFTMLARKSHHFIPPHHDLVICLQKR